MTTPIPTTQLRVQSTLSEGMRVDATVRNQKITINEPAEVGGTNQGPSPTETALAALAACASMVIRITSKKHKINLAGVDAEIDATFDLRGVMFKEPVNVPFREIALSLRLSDDVDDTQLELLKQAVHDFCPIHQLFSQAGTRIVEEWQITADCPPGPPGAAHHDLRLHPIANSRTGPIHAHPPHRHSRNNLTQGLAPLSRRNVQLRHARPAGAGGKGCGMDLP